MPSTPDLNYSTPAPLVSWPVPRRSVLSWLGWLIAPPAGKRTIVSLIAWWELWRIPYNAILLTGIMVSFLVFLYALANSSKLTPGEDAVEPVGVIFAVPVGLVLANIFFTAGWVAEIFVNRIRRNGTKRFGPIMLALGVLFSLFVVSLPAWFGLLFWLTP